MICVVVISALLLDQWLGEPRRFHPLVGFGNLAVWLERRTNTQTTHPRSLMLGAFAVLILILPLVVITVLLGHWFGQYGPLLDIVVLYWAVGFKSLVEHVKPVQSYLKQGRTDQARDALSRIVSRDTDVLDDNKITKATIETTLENGCDAVFGVLFCYVVGGAPLVVAYRLINTLDAMWGYRTERYELFGKIAARLDDALNYVPARLTAVSYAICGNMRESIKSWQAYAKLLASPNAGPVMAAGAGSLNVQLGGDTYYHQRLHKKSIFGGQKAPQIDDIGRALKLVTSATILWCALLCVWSLLSGNVL